MRSHTLVSVALLAFLGAACADQPSQDRAALTDTAVPESVRADFPVINWNNPLGVRSSTLGAAGAELDFTPQPPGATVGDPVRISFSDPHMTGARDRAVAWVYDDPRFGRFYVEELLPTMNQKELEDLVACGPDETSCTTQGWSLVQIRDGVTALLIYAPPENTIATSITWLEGGLEYTIEGPRSSLTDAMAVQIANEV